MYPLCKGLRQGKQEFIMSLIGNCVPRTPKIPRILAETVRGSPLTLPKATSLLLAFLTRPLPVPELGCELTNPLKSQGRLTRHLRGGGAARGGRSLSPTHGGARGPGCQGARLLAGCPLTCLRPPPPPSPSPTQRSGG